MKIRSVLHVCVCVFTEADVHPGTVCHRLSCRKRPIISSHGSSGGVKCVICAGSNWQPSPVEADWGQSRAAVTPSLRFLPSHAHLSSLLPMEMLYGAVPAIVDSLLPEKLQIYKRVHFIPDISDSGVFVGF